MKSEAELESVVSRESSFLFNNLILLASCFAILWGTLFPVISEAVTGEKVSVDAPWFNRVNIPIGLFLLFLTGVGPLLAWRKTSIDSMRRIFMWPTIVGVLSMCEAAVNVQSRFPASPGRKSRQTRRAWVALCTMLSRA